MSEAETVFKAMADQTRQRTLRLLHNRELSVSELVEVLGQPQSTVSRHLKTLREAGLIRDRRDGTTVLYSVQESQDGQVLSDLSGKLLDWVAQQPLPGPVSTRLNIVLQRRRAMSEQFFDRIGRHWDHLREESFGATFHLEALLALLPSGWSVADIGAGTGYLLPTLARRFERVIGVEPVDRMLEVARHRIEPYGFDNVELHKGDLDQLPITKEAVDLAIAVLVLHHVPSPRDALAELCRIVKPGGQVLIVEQRTHDNEAFHQRMQDRWWGFGSDEFAGWLRTAGFDRLRLGGLATTDQAADAPELFVVTGVKQDVNGNTGAKQNMEDNTQMGNT